jgi:putative oxidoreductase
MTEKMTRFEIQHLMLRVLLGIDFTHHFAEKFGLLGQVAYRNIVAYFGGVAPGDPHIWVLVAGLCEFGAFVGFTFGLFTRTAALGTALYLLVASVMGGHFSNGFTWANSGGGWEFPLLWTVLCSSFAITGGGSVSLDAWLRRSWPSLPRWLVS